jgi:hypothetical protein
MKKTIILGVSVMLMLSSCASAADTRNVGISTVSSTTSGGETPIESLPPNPDARLDDDRSKSGPGEPGDTPPPAEDERSAGQDEGVPLVAQAAMLDLAEYLGVSIDVIDWVSYEEVEWPNGSLGCPQPGMSYTQAIVNGSLIVFEVNGVLYEYHSGAGQEAFLCLPSISARDDGLSEGSSGLIVVPVVPPNPGE